MDKLKPYEANLLIDSIPLADRSTWEQTRIHIACTAAMFSKNPPKPSDIIKFKWDDSELNKESTTEVTAEDIQKMKTEASKIENILNGTRL